MTYSNYPDESSQKAVTTNKNRDNRNLIYGLLAAALLGTWGYFFYDKSKNTELTGALQAQLHVSDSAKNNIQVEYNAALQRLDELTSMNNSLDSLVKMKGNELSKLKSRIQSILNKQNKTAADLKEAKKLIQELNTKISELVTETEALRNENELLKTENQQIIVQKQTLQREHDSTKVVKKKAEEKLDVASTLNASNIQIAAIDVRRNGKEVEKEKAKRVDKIRVSFEVFNRVGEQTAKDMYVIITDPSGAVVKNEAMGSGSFATRDEGEKPFTQKSNVQFTAGQSIPVTVEWKPGTRFVEGVYKIAIYNNGYKIGEGNKSLKKGGIFG